jgi:hypothetical protein
MKNLYSGFLGFKLQFHPAYFQKNFFQYSLGDNFISFDIVFQFDFRIVQFSRYKPLYCGMVETRGIEPLTSCVQGRRSPS